MTTQQSAPQQYNQAIVKQVLSGDTVVLRNVSAKGGPPKERTLSLSSVTAPKLARRPNQNGEGGTKDDPYAWEAREFLRKLIIGKKVFFTVDANVQNTTREYGTIYLCHSKDSPLQNITETMVSEGLVDVRRSGIKSTEAHQRLCTLEDTAKQSGKGKHGPHASEHIRNINWSVENHRNFVDSLNRKPVKAVVEHIRDGSTMRVLLMPPEIPEFCSIMLMLSGIRCPTFRDETPEPFAEEAKFFTECRLLQRDVDVILESVSNQNFLGTVIHPNGNIAELLLAEGFAKCVDWSLQCVTSGLEKLRAAEKSAKGKRLRLWKDYAPTGVTIDAKEREFQGKVVEVINADAMVIKLADGSTKKIFLASIRPPRLPENDPDASKARLRPLYDIPFMFEAREFLRKKLVGKKVNVTIDYKQPASNNFPEKVCCTVRIGGINVAEALVSKGLATVVRYKPDDDQRSAHYDELLSAETKAIKAAKGMHNKKDTPVHRIVDLSGDLQKSKQFFPFLQRAGRMDAVVEFVASGSRLRAFVPRENCLITFLLGGISCLRASRDTKSGMQPGDPYGDDALTYTKDLCLQKEVQIEVESMDKAGNFIGWLFIENVNLSEALVKEGFAEVHTNASRSPYCRQLQNAQEDAKKKKLRMWEKENDLELEIKKVIDSPAVRTEKYIEAIITEMRADHLPDLIFFAQNVEDGPKLEELSQNMRQEFATNPPLPGAYRPKKGDLCAALFKDDNLWYRARIDKVYDTEVFLTFIDFGNRDITPTENLAALPSTYQSLPPCATEYALAFVKLPKDDPEIADAGLGQFWRTVADNRVLLNVEYKANNWTYATLYANADKTNDVGKDLVLGGCYLTDKKQDKKFMKVIKEYLICQDTARKERRNLWQYGDVTEDDAKEFG